VKRDNTLKLDYAEAKAAHAKAPENYVTLFHRNDARVLLFAPRGTDTQKPHTQDELYIVAAGSGTFVRGEEKIAFAAGDVLFVAAEVPHRFEDFTDDFYTWVVFYGPWGGIPGDV
jgi:mannose-6-phosphate isomerase-like protein (cupin superfamily)